MAKKVKWMQRAFAKNKGALHRSLGVPEDEPIPASKLESARNSKDALTRKRAALALTARAIARRRKRR